MKRDLRSEGDPQRQAGGHSLAARNHITNIHSVHYKYLLLALQTAIYITCQFDHAS
jgi:hypothetical protein